MHIPSFRPLLAALALAALAGPAAQAGLLTTAMDARTPIFTISVPSRGVDGERGYVGPNSVTFDGADPALAYCTDLFRNIGVNDRYEATPSPVSDLANGALVAKILGVDAAWGDDSALHRAAVQLAIWDVVESGRAGLGSWFDPLAVDAKRVDRGSNYYYVYGDDAKKDLLFGLKGDLAVYDESGSGVLQRMGALIGAALDSKSPAPKVSYFAPSTSYGQGFVALVPGPSVQAVPEPSSLAMAGLGLAVLSGAWLRRKRPRA